MKFVVTGTDTNIGKTVFSAGLCGLLGARYWKPVQAGLPGDNDVVAQLSGAQIVPSVYTLQLAASPHQGAAEEGITIDPDRLVPPDSPVVIEGAGGLMVPLGPDILFIDVFARWKLPLILCARTRLGTINHTLLSIEAIRRRDIPLHGVAFIGDANDESEKIICQMGQVKRLGRLPVIEPLTAGRLAGVFGKTFEQAHFA
ncbi:MAG: dethiobiotin synthase [Alphaproteobacteria bacterium]